MSSKNPKFAVVGAGFVSKRHFESIKEIDGEVLMVADIDEEARNNVVDFVPDAAVYSNHSFFTADPLWGEVDYVVICSWNDSHVPIAKWALRKGKKVLCEKPLAMNMGELEEVLDEEDLYVVLQLKHHKVMAEMKEVEPITCSMHVKVKRDPEKFWGGWQGDDTKSGGILNILGIHYFRALIDLFGAPTSFELTKKERNEVKGTLQFENFQRDVNFTIAIDDTDLEQDRYVMLNGTKYRFSNKDNLSLECLHTDVYRAMLKGIGTRPKDLVEVTQLIEDMRKYEL